MGRGRKKRPRSSPAPRTRAAAAEGAETGSTGGAVAVLDAPEPVAAPIEEPTAKTRGDGWFALGVAAVAALIFFSTFSSHVALGDAPESVAGVRSLGVLHAPGYPAYVLLGWLFGHIVAVGSWAFRLNLFSVVCASATIGITFLLARVFGASRSGSIVGALILATTASFWFNAGFAKHYALSSLLVTSAALCVIRWQQGRSHLLMIGAGLALGLGFGSSWELAIIMLVALAALIALGPRRPSLGIVAGSAVTLVVAAVGLFAFVMVRAGQHPAVDWGDATTTSRLVSLIAQRDFQDTHGTTGTATGVLGHLPGRVAAYIGMLLRDMGIGAIALAIAGAVLSWRTLRRERWVFLIVLAAFDVIAVTLVAGFDSISGFLTVMVVGGFLVDAMIAVAIFAAFGVDEVVTRVSRSIGERRAGKAFRSRADDMASAARGWVLAGIVVLTIVPSLVVHYSYADHRGPPLADRYAQHMLDGLPQGANLLTYEFDWTFPVTYLQTVEHVRPDVHVVAVKELGLDWYREQVAHDLNVETALRPQRIDLEILSLIHALQARGPLYVDTGVMSIFRDKIGYESQGLVARIVAGPTGPQVAPNLGALVAQMDAADRHDGLLAPHSNNFPNPAVHFIYDRAHIELAKQYAKQGNLGAATAEVAHAAADYPADTSTDQILRYLRQSDTPRDKALTIIADM
jgi:4-amino-4-deoxy-L-arabinose transferase-like glycosyltransferase